MSEGKVTEPSVTYNAGQQQVKRDHMGRWQPLTEYAGQRKAIEGALRRTLAQDRGDKLRKACERLLDQAAFDPDPRISQAAFVIISDRLDGKPVARIETNDTDSRNMGLADLVALVLQARKADAVDAPQQEGVVEGGLQGEIKSEGGGV
jgi:hypothetical protein